MMKNTLFSLSLASIVVAAIACNPPKSESEKAVSQTSTVATVSSNETAQPAVAESPMVAVSNVSRVIDVDSGTAAEGKVPPGFTWKGADGKMHALKDYAGKVVMLNFWGTWCPPCRMELPDIVKLREEFHSKGFEVIGLNVGEEDRKPDNGLTVEDHVAKFAQQKGMKYPLALVNSRLLEAYGGIESVPTTFILNKRGEISSVMVGMMSEDEFRKAINKVM